MLLKILKAKTLPIGKYKDKGKNNEKIKSVDLIINANSDKIVFSNGETLIKIKDTLSLNFETKKEENA